MFKPFFKNQKGAMFGLDARIALAIFGGLSVVMGASMLQIMGDSRVDNLLQEHSKISSAVDALQEDLQGSIDNALTTVNDAERYMALMEEAGVSASAQGRWHGPYISITGRGSQHAEYGAMGITPKQLNTNNDCLAATITSRNCYYNLVYAAVPMVTINALNTAIDGAAEATPAAEGIIQWQNISGSNAQLFMRLGLVSP